MVADSDRAVRVALFRLFAELGSCPSRSHVARRAGLDEDEVEGSYRRLHDDHVLVLGDDGEPWMANPFSAVDTPFPVTVGERSYYGNCIWDALGIIAMLGGSGTVLASCPCCGAPLHVEVADGGLTPGECIGHFAVPAAHWWDDIGHT